MRRNKRPAGFVLNRHSPREQEQPLAQSVDGVFQGDAPVSRSMAMRLTVDSAITFVEGMSNVSQVPRLLERKKDY